MKKLFWTAIACSVFLLSACGSSEESAINDAAMGAAPTQMTTAVVTNAVMDIAVEETEAAFAGDKKQSAAAGDGMNYFTFRQTENIYCDDMGRQLLTESLTVPEFFSNDPELHQWVNETVSAIYNEDTAFGQSLVSFAKQDLNGTGEDDFYPYSHRVTMGVARHDSRVASVLSLSSAYSGGAHPNSLQTVCNLDLVNLRVLKLEDVILPDGAPGLTELVLTDIGNRFSSIGDEALFEDYDRMVSGALSYGNMTAYWYFTEEGIVIFFNQYELGPFASGIIKAAVPYEQLDGILRPEYFPPEHAGLIIGVDVAQEPAEDDWIYYVELSEGETVYASVDGKVDHVQFSEVFWEGRTVVGESMLFSVNQISDGATLAVTGDLSDPSKIYALEYYDANGGPYVLYVYQSKAYSELPEIE